jgi:polysaccharide pyruvyl transferase WcaK-like protein
MPTALLAGAFGQRNPGDDALLEAFVRALPGWDTVATTSQRLVDADGDRATVSASEPARVARTAANADAVVFAGGTIFKTLPAHTGRGPLDLLRNGLALAYGAKALGKPLALVGVGAAPIASRAGQALARRLVAQADLLVLRDEESADVLAQVGAQTPFRVGADPAWTLLDGPPSGELLRNGPVVVALSAEAAVPGGDRAGDVGALADDLAAALVPVLAAGHAVALQPWRIGGAAGPDDLDLARAINARLGASAQMLLPPADLEEARDLFGRALLVVGMRLHSLVAAAAAGTPFVAVAHEPKLAAAARRMNQTAVVPQDGGGLDSQHLAAAILAAIDMGAPPRPSAVQAEVTRAEQGFRLLRLLLSGGRSDDAETIGALPLRPAEWSS